ncbi:hypothetical protein CCACVL1_27440 [Corchorus capsularis]|uniref:Uncharacterized protein n=1 Tax=Corchorus capsularis TaxID=210143 RepID=A0A1R3GAB1_COCAP|nr:hypothetical protein CCACVL1_27440 [Corchorus capsularis]
MADIKTTSEAADLAVDEMHGFGPWMLVKSKKDKKKYFSNVLPNEPVNIKKVTTGNFSKDNSNLTLPKPMSSAPKSSSLFSIPDISPSVIIPKISSAQDIMGKRDLISSALPTPILNSCAPFSVASEVSQTQAENEEEPQEVLQREEQRAPDAIQAVSSAERGGAPTTQQPTKRANARAVGIFAGTAPPTEPVTNRVNKPVFCLPSQEGDSPQSSPIGGGGGGGRRKRSVSSSFNFGECHSRGN